MFVMWVESASFVISHLPCNRVREESHGVTWHELRDRLYTRETYKAGVRQENKPQFPS